MLANAGTSARPVVYVLIATAFSAETPKVIRAQCRIVANQIWVKVPRRAAILDDAEPGMLASMTFPSEHSTRLRAKNPIELHHAWDTICVRALCISR